jgi:hypothetical protein
MIFEAYQLHEEWNDRAGTFLVRVVVVWDILFDHILATKHSLLHALIYPHPRQLAT